MRSDELLALDTAYEHSSGDRARLDPTGARLTSLVHGGHELTVPDDGTGDVWWGGFLMLPWAGLLRGAHFRFDGRDYEVPVDWPPHALPGLARKAQFTNDGSALTAELPQSWPFGGTARASAQLSDGKLQHLISVTAADQPMPVTLGWHPWFRRQLSAGRPVEIHLPDDAEMLERDPDGVPTGQWVQPKSPPYDDCFRTDGVVTLVWPGAGALSIGSDGGFVSVFSGNDRGVVVEPQNGPSESLAHDLAPGKSLTLTTELRWEPSND